MISESKYEKLPGHFRGGFRISGVNSPPPGYMPRINTDITYLILKQKIYVRAPDIFTKLGLTGFKSGRDSTTALD